MNHVDRSLERKLTHLANTFHLATAIETGTGSGLRTWSLAKIFDYVHTIELDSERYVASRHVAARRMVRRHCGSSIQVLPQILKQIDEPVCFVLSAHGNGVCPLEDDLRTIAQLGHPKSVLVISTDVISAWQTENDHSSDQANDILKSRLSDIFGSNEFESELSDVATPQHPDFTQRPYLMVTPCGEPVKSSSQFTLLTTFGDQSLTRYAEYLSCLRDNLKLPAIKRLVLFYDGRRPLPNMGEKLIVVPAQSRPQFQDLFDYANRHCPGGRCIVANADIAFDQTLEKLTGKNLSHQLVVLKRWEESQEGKIRFVDQPGSQDAWIFQSPLPISDAHFFLGVPGCDKFLAWLAHEANLDVANLGEQIVSRHRHQSNWRLRGRIQSMCKPGHSTAILTPLNSME